jgi:predicted tellurium resistance membrane protein TerC
MLYIIALLCVTILGWFGFVMALSAFEALWIGDFKNAIWPGIGFSAVAACFILSVKN